MPPAAPVMTATRSLNLISMPYLLFSMRWLSPVPFAFSAVGRGGVERRRSVGPSCRGATAVHREVNAGDIRCGIRQQPDGGFAELRGFTYAGQRVFGGREGIELQVERVL